MSLIIHTTFRSIFIGGKSYMHVNMIFMAEYAMHIKSNKHNFFFNLVKSINFLSTDNHDSKNPYLPGLK